MRARTCHEVSRKAEMVILRNPESYTYTLSQGRQPLLLFPPGVYIRTIVSIHLLKGFGFGLSHDTQLSRVEGTVACLIWQ